MAKRKDNEVPWLVEGAGLNAAIIQALFEEMKAQKLSPKAFHVLGTPDGQDYIEKFVELLADDFDGDPINVVGTTFPIDVDYDHSFYRKISELKRKRRVAWAHKGIGYRITNTYSTGMGGKLWVSSVSSQGEREIKAGLVYLNQPTEVDSLHYKLSGEGRRLGTLTEFADFVDQHFGRLRALRKNEEDRILRIVVPGIIYERQSTQYVMSLLWTDAGCVLHLDENAKLLGSGQYCFTVHKNT